MIRRLYLSGRFFMVLAFFQFIGVLSGFYPLLRPVYFASWPAIGFLLWYDRRQLLKVRLTNFSLGLPPILELGRRYNSKLSFDLMPHFGQAPEIEMEILNCLHWDQENLRADGQTNFRFEANLEILAKRLGYEKLQNINIYASSSLRLWELELKVETPHIAFRVIPTREALTDSVTRELMRQQQIIFLGNRRLLRNRQADQFHSIREYQYPDPLKNIDAKKTARFGKLMSRTYDSTVDQHLVIVLDLGRALSGEIHGSTKLDYYLAAAYRLAQEACARGDRVSLYAFSDKIHYQVRSSRSIQDFRALFEGHPELCIREAESLYENLLPQIANSIGQRALVILLTDFMRSSVRENIQLQLGAFAEKHMLILLGLLASQYDLEEIVLHPVSDQQSSQDYARLMYAYWLSEQIGQFREESSHFGSGVLCISEKNWMAVVDRLYGLARNSIRL